MFRDGDTIFLDQDTEDDPYLPRQVDASKAPELYTGLGVVISHALSVQMILEDRRPTGISDEEWCARTANMDGRVDVLISCRDQLRVLAAEEIAAAGIDEAIRAMDIDGATQPRLNEE